MDSGVVVALTLVFEGPGFKVLGFEIAKGGCETFRDADGRLIPFLLVTSLAPLLRGGGVEFNVGVNMATAGT